VIKLRVDWVKLIQHLAFFATASDFPVDPAAEIV
jgi:hypothetical protein